MFHVSVSMCIVNFFCDPLLILFFLISDTTRSVHERFLDHLRGVDNVAVGDEKLSLMDFNDIEDNNASFELSPNFYIYLLLFLFTTLFLFIWGYWPPEESCSEFIARLYERVCAFIVRFRLCLGSYIHSYINRLTEEHPLT